MRWRRSDADFDEEVKTHLALLTERFVRQGLSPDKAAVAARRQFGNIRSLMEERADLSRWRRIESCWWDLKLALRGLRRQALFAVTAIVLLALGIGANTAIFSVLDDVLIRPLPVDRPHELALITLAISPDARFQGAARLGFVSLHEFLGPDTGIPSSVISRLRESNQVFSGVLAEGPRVTAELRLLDAGANPAVVSAAFVSGNYFSLLGVASAAGRVLTESDSDRTHTPAVMISHRYWLRHLGGDPNVIGKPASLNDTACVIVGVASHGFDGSAIGDPTDIWVPLTFRATVAPQAHAELMAIGRLRNGVTLADAQAGVRAVLPAVRIGEAFDFQDAKPDWFDLIVTDGSTGVSNLRARHAGALMIGMGAAMMVLLIACANLAGLVLARAGARRREVALLVSLGAGPWRVVRQLFLQNLVLALLGGVLGWYLASAGSSVLIRLLSGSTEALAGVRADLRLLSFASITTIGAALLFGLAPAIRIARLDPTRALNEGASSAPTIGVGPARWRVLVAAQIAASMILLLTALLFVRTLANLDAIDLGFNADTLMLAQFDTGSLERGTPLAARANDLERRLQSLPGITSAAIVTSPPFGESGGSGRVMVAGYLPAPDEAYFTLESVIGPGFFRTSGIRLVRGRDFISSDAGTPGTGSEITSGPSRAAIVNEAFARKFYGTTDVLGRRFAMSRIAYDIIGVAQDARYENLRRAVAPMVYKLVSQDPSHLRKLAILLRLGGGAAKERASVSSAIRAEARAVGVRVATLATLRELVDASRQDERLAAAVSGGAGVLAMVLVAVGVFGTVAYAVACRTRELGIRAALGGGRWSILAMLMRETGVLVVAGIAVGVPLALAITRLLSSKFFGVGAADPVSLGAAAVLLTVVAAVASLMPAYRAAGVHPMAALRHE